MIVLAKEKWVRFRHQITLRILKIIMKPALYIKCGFRYKKIPNLKEPCLILYNHTTAEDQFFVGLMANTKTYFVMSDDLVIHRFAYKIMKFLVHPIPYKKASTDFSILKTCKKVVNEGGSIAISPEGNRTYSGVTCYINPTITKMIQFLKLPVVFLHLEGGFGVHPRFSNQIRKGKSFGNVQKIVYYEEYKDLSHEELYEMVKENIYTNENRQTGPYQSRKKAEYLERVIYRCPICGVTHFESKRNVLKCTTCGKEHLYNEYKEFIGLNGDTFFKNVYEWYRYQEEELKKTHLLDLPEEEILTTDIVSFYFIIPRKKKIRIANQVILKLHSNHYELIYDGVSKKYLFNDIISAGIFGKNKIDFFTKDMAYQIKSDCRFNALKYVQFFYKYKNEMEGINNEFLGL